MTQGTKGEERLNAFFKTLEMECSLLQVSGVRQVAVDRLRGRARKRAAFRRPHLRDEAVSKFVKTNEEVGSFVIALDRQIEADARHYITVMLERFTSTFDDTAIQSVLEMGFIFDNWRFGPGASNGVLGTHCAEKIQQPMTCNASSEPLVLRLRRSNPYLCRFDCDHKVKGTDVIRGSRLTTVPKNEETERTIAIEPSGQMALQLAAGRYLEGTLRYIGLDISKQQPKNKAAAQRGSVSGSLATIDMKAASDMISIELVRRLLPPKWFDLLMTLRSEEIELPGGEWLKLNMISTMGNGFTFPLMTLILCSLIYGYRCQNGGPSLFIDWSDTCVFGDDVIVPTHEFEPICEVFESAGFVINRDKSFGDGPFRESCGGDYYEGTDVTPFYVRSLATNPDVYVAINQVVAWCRKTRVDLYQTILHLSHLIDGKALLVPEWLNPDQGILTCQVARRYKYLKLAPRYQRLSPESPFALMLAIGGYIEEQGPHLVFVPRSVKRAKYEVREARLPQGYLEGWDPGRGPRESSLYAAQLLAALLS